MATLLNTKVKIFLIMKNIKYNVLDSRPAGSFSSLLDELLQEKYNGPGKQFSPAVDIYEEDQLYAILISVPGIKKEDIKIDIVENELQISGQRNAGDNKSSKKYYLQEIPRGSFTKSFNLPKDVQQEKIEAKYEEGILKLLLPKNQKLKHKYQIEIK